MEEIDDRERKEEGEEREEKKEEPSFDRILIDAIVPHLRYEALVKLSLSSPDVAQHINRRWFHVWFRAAMRYVEAAGIPDAGLVNVERICGSVGNGDGGMSGRTFGANSFGSSNAFAPLLDAGNATLSGWSSSGGDLPIFPFCARFQVHLLLMISDCGRNARKNNADEVYSVSWQPLVVGIVKPMTFEVVLRNKQVVSVTRNSDDDAKQRLHSPQSIDDCFTYRPFLKSFSWRKIGAGGCANDICLSNIKPLEEKAQRQQKQRQQQHPLRKTPLSTSVTVRTAAAARRRDDFPSHLRLTLDFVLNDEARSTDL